MPNRHGPSLTEFTNTYVPFTLLVALALIMPETTQNLDRYRTIYTIWATILLLIPPLCIYLSWTFSYLAFLFHFYWAVFVIFKGIHGTFAGQGTFIAATNFLLTLWWGTDVLLSWLVSSFSTWLRWERTGAHVFVFSIFSITTLVLRPTPITRALGLALTIAVVMSFAIWLIVRDSTRADDNLPQK